MGVSLAVQVLGKARTARSLPGTWSSGSSLATPIGPGGLDRSPQSAADQKEGGSAMTAVEVLAIIVVFITGVITGIVFLVSLASRREDRRARLSREAPDRITLAARLLTGLCVHRSGDDPSWYDYP